MCRKFGDAFNQSPLDVILIGHQLIAMAQNVENVFRNDTRLFLFEKKNIGEPTKRPANEIFSKNDVSIHIERHAIHLSVLCSMWWRHPVKIMDTMWPCGCICRTNRIGSNEVHPSDLRTYTQIHTFIPAIPCLMLWRIDCYHKCCFLYTRLFLFAPLRSWSATARVHISIRTRIRFNRIDD